MSAFTTEERIALLLSVLGNEVADAAVQSMNPTRANYVQRLVKDYQVNPPSDEETDYVIDDFIKYFHFALHAVAPEVEQAQEAAAAAAAAAAEGGGGGGVEQGAAAGAASAGGGSRTNESPAPTAKPRKANSQTTYFPKVEPSEDAIADLNRLDPYQISTALENDHPKTVALVLSRLESQLAAAVLEDLSTSTRNSAIVFLSQESTVSPLIVDKILRSTVENAIKVEFRENTVDQTKVLAALMRSVPKKLRGELMSKLEESNADLCANVKQQLYVFEDICRLNDRDIQKMLGEIQTDYLIVGLQKADDVLTDKLLGNLSSRARQSVIEEMEFKTNATQEEIDEARAELTAVLARLDEAGEVTLK